MERISLKYNITWIEKAITEKSYSKYSSSYTACVHDISLGELDMCVGAFWTTTERLLLSSFSNTVYYDEFYLIVHTTKDNSFYSNFITPFEPFEVQAWLWVVSVSLYMAIAMRIIHKTGGRYLKDEQSESSISISAKN